MTEARLPNWQCALWGTGQIAVQVFRDVPSLLLLFYMTQVLAVPPFMAGATIFVPKLIWGVLCDFSIGRLLDRLPPAFERRYFLLIGAILAPLALILLFVPSAAETPLHRALNISMLLCFYMATFSMFSVPHLAIGTELSRHPHEQSRVMAWRTAFIGAGLLCGAALAPFLVQYFGGGVHGYRSMSLCLAALCSIALTTAFFGAKEVRVRTNADAPVQGNWAAARANSAFLLLFFAYFSQLVGQGSAYATLAYVVTFKLLFPAPFKALSMSVLVTGLIFIVVQPLLLKIVRRWGTRLTFMIGSALYALSLVWLAVSPTGSTLSLIGASVALGLTCSSAFQSVFARLSAIIAKDAAASPGSRSRAGFYSSLFVVNDKVAFALGGTLLAGTILSIFGFVPGGVTSQPPGALKGITLAFAGVPVLANGLAILLMAFSPEPGESSRPLKYSPVAWTRGARGS